jgi:hypothetical protein
MQHDDEQWKELCKQAAVEQDPQKLTKLVAEIVRLIDLRKQHIQQKQTGGEV